MNEVVFNIDGTQRDHLLLRCYGFQEILLSEYTKVPVHIAHVYKDLGGADRQAKAGGGHC